MLGVIAFGITIAAQGRAQVVYGDEKYIGGAHGHERGADADAP